ncbi:MAG: hypothetical protein HN416_12140 [Nitrospina sp.]|nr:hypothetical protein [Nitrospina sp.]
MKEITKPAYTILDQLDQQIDDSLQPGSMGDHMRNADRIRRRNFYDLEAWLSDPRKQAQDSREWVKA